MYFVKKPYLQLPQRDGVTVMWETDEAGSSELRVWDALCPDCGDVEYIPQGQPTMFYGEAGHMHRVKASGLAAGRDYCYRAITTSANGHVTGGQYVFRTQPPEGAPLSFAVTSETGGSGSPMGTIDALVKAIAAERPDFLLFAGDMVADGRRAQDWDEYMFTPFKDVICHTPFYHCAGNHEQHAEHMKRFLATPGCGYYDFTYGCAHFVALDSTQLSEHVADADGCYTIAPTQPLTEDNPQVRFLIESLADSVSPWKFVYLHYPPYFSGTWQAQALRPLCAIFERYKVDFVFTSHAIVYERSHPIAGDSVDYAGGVRYIVAGGAGAEPQWFHHKKAWHTAKSRAAPHFVHLSATPGQLEYQAIDLEGRLFDALTLRKK